MLTLKFKYFPILKNATIVDVGCGEGRHAIHAYLEQDANIIGLDQNLNDLATAKERSAPFLRASESASLTFMRGDALNLPFENNTVDGIICSEVLEHIKDYQTVLQEAYRVLKPNAIFMVSVPREWPEKICWKLSREYHEVDGGHLRIFSRKKLKHEITLTGFEHYKTHYAHALHSPYWWLRCWKWFSQDESQSVKLYHRFLVWDLMDKPLFTRLLESALNPILGKSVVMYFKKHAV